jgi:hypothetical protein
LFIALSKISRILKAVKNKPNINVENTVSHVATEHDRDTPLLQKWEDEDLRSRVER